MDFNQFCGDVTPYYAAGFMLQHEDVNSDSTMGLKWQRRPVTSPFLAVAGESVFFDGSGLILC